MNAEHVLGASKPFGRRLGVIRVALLTRLFSSRVAAAEIFHRAWDLIAVCAAIIPLAPVLLGRAFLGRIAVGRTFERETRVGRFRASFERLRFAGRFPGGGLAVLLNILRGDLSWTGPRPLTESEASTVPPPAWERFSVRPGLVSIHQLRSRLGLAYAAEHEHDREHYYRQSVWRSIGMLLRAFPAVLIGAESREATGSTAQLFGVNISSITMDEALDWIVRHARLCLPGQVCFINAHCLNIAYKNSEYKEVLKTADRVFPDGVGIRIACRIRGSVLAANINGTDLFPRLCQRLAQSRLSLFLLGSREDVVTSAASKMRKRYPGLRVAGVRHGYFAPGDEGRIVDEINHSGASILLVGMGVPEQDLWIARNTAKLAPAVKIGVGGLFDFYSGRIRRAPQWMREIGMEWAWRLFMEPGRMWRRYIIGNPLFLFRVWREPRCCG